MRVQPFKKLFVHLFTSIIRFFILSGDNAFYNFAAKTMQIHWHVEFDGKYRDTRCSTCIGMKFLAHTLALVLTWVPTHGLFRALACELTCLWTYICTG